MTWGLNVSIVFFSEIDETDRETPTAVLRCLSRLWAGGGAIGSGERRDRRKGPKSSGGRGWTWN